MKLDPTPSQTVLAREWDRLVRGALRRGGIPEDTEATIDLASYHPAAVSAARAGWSRRMVDEHRSATVFSGLLPQLIEAEAPIDMQGVALRMAMDELRHGALSGRVVQALGGEARVEIEDASEAPAKHEGASPLVRLVRNVVYASCLSETVSVSLTAAEREQTEEPFVAEVLDQLLGDETLHARFGWVLLGWARERWSEEEREAIEAYLPFAAKHYVTTIQRRLGKPKKLPEEIARDRVRLGVLDTRLAHEVLLETLKDVVGPRLEDAGLRLRRSAPPA